MTTKKNEPDSIDVFKWRHKKTKREIRVLPWWEMLKSDIVLDGSEKKRRYKIGALIQIGWLLENEHGVFFGVGPKAEKEFESLGEWKDKK